MMLSKRKNCQTTVRLRVSRVELLKDTGEQRLVRVAAGERHPDLAYGDAHQCANLEQFEPDGLALRPGHRSAVQTQSPKGFQQQVCDRREGAFRNAMDHSRYEIRVRSRHCVWISAQVARCLPRARSTCDEGGTIGDTWVCYAGKDCLEKCVVYRSRWSDLIADVAPRGFLT